VLSARPCIRPPTAFSSTRSRPFRARSIIAALLPPNFCLLLLNRTCLSRASSWQRVLPSAGANLAQAQTSHAVHGPEAAAAAAAAAAVRGRRRGSLLLAAPRGLRGTRGASGLRLSGWPSRQHGMCCRVLRWCVPPALVLETRCSTTCEYKLVCGCTLQWRSLWWCSC
jgi:hypothetical protein